MTRSRSYPSSAKNRATKNANAAKKTIASDGHEHARDLLVRERRDVPEARRLLVELVDRLGEEGEEERPRAREDERGEEVDGPTGGGKVVRRVLEHRPPEEHPGEDVGHVLELEQRMVPQGGVVDGRHVPDGVVDEPDWKRDERVRQRPEGGVATERVGEGGADAEHEERGHPFRERNVLKEVRREEVVERDRRDGRNEHGRGEQKPGRERDHPRPRGRVPAHGHHVGGPHDDEGRDHPGREVPAPGRRLHRRKATMPAERGCSSVGRASAFQAEGRGFESRRPLSPTEVRPASRGMTTSVGIAGLGGRP